MPIIQGTPHEHGLILRMFDTVMQIRIILYLVLNFRSTELKHLAYSHEYSFFVHLSEDKTVYFTLFLSHYSLCFIVAKCQNIAVSLLQGYITLSALEKKKQTQNTKKQQQKNQNNPKSQSQTPKTGKLYSTLEKRKKFGWCWEKNKEKKERKKRGTLHHRAGNFCQPNSQPVNVASLTTNLQQCYYSFTTLFMKGSASLESIKRKTILGKREKTVIVDSAHVWNLVFERTLKSTKVNTEEWREYVTSWS